MAIIILYGLTPGGCTSDRSPDELKAYEDELDSLRKEFGGSKEMPDVEFYMFGMGNRTKLIYRDGVLKNLITHDTIREWKIKSFRIIPSEYTVRFESEDKEDVTIFENQEGVWIRENEILNLVEGTSTTVLLPEFSEYKYGRIMKVLHHEILINILCSKPLPNLLVYKNPWRRDAAMMAMCLKETGNIDLIKDWVLSINDPFDRNNAGETEADNLGQTLFLLSFFTDKDYPLVNDILNTVKKFEVISPSGKYINGRSDFHEAPVYQTKWMKYGLKSLGITDSYIIPDIPDNYSALFWWDYRDSYMPGTDDADDRDNYPYLGWACDHFHGVRKSPVSSRNYPLTWEINASQADYKQMNIIDLQYVNTKNASPHTWHASEVFLYLHGIMK